jgi:hypothetical protein
MPGADVCKMRGHPAMTGLEVKHAVEQCTGNSSLAMQIYNGTKPSALAGGGPLSGHGVPALSPCTGLCSRFGARICRCNKRIRVGNRS